MINHCDPALSDLQKTAFPLSLSLCLARPPRDTSTCRAASDLPDRGSALWFGGLQLGKFWVSFLFCFEVLRICGLGSFLGFRVEGLGGLL